MVVMAPLITASPRAELTNPAIVNQMARLLRKIDTSHCATEVDGELVMIHVETGKFFSLKGVGLDIWRRLDVQPDVDLICDDLVREYGVSEDECRQTVDAFVTQLTTAGFAKTA